jgi:protein-tyrosine phosphatase
MSAVVVNLNSVEDRRDVVHRAVEALAAGQLVVFPTETVYGLAASALAEDGVRRLIAVKGRPNNQPITLAIKGAEDVLDYAPGLSLLGQRLARRCWPGPCTLVLDDDHPDGVVRQLPESVQRVICPTGTIGLRVPAHPVILSVLNLSAGPLLLTSANRSGQSDPVTADAVVRTLGDDVAIVLDDGRCKFAQSSSVVKVRENQWEILRRGVLDEAALARLASYMVLFVCTGNTCRSPMACALMQRQMAAQLGSPTDELERRGLLIASAGTAAQAGGPASREAIQVMSERGMDISQHESQPLSERLVRFADRILTMTRGHREAILAQWPNAAPRTHLLGGQSGDVADPMGGSADAYRRAADQIESFLAAWVEELKLDRILASSRVGG